MSSNEIQEAIFGASDGIVTALGVVIPLAIAHKSMVIVVLGLAISSAVSMGGGELVSDGTSSKSSAIAMTIATLIGTILPALPFFFMKGLVADVLAALLVLAASTVIAEVTAVHKGRRTGYLQTFGVLSVASILTTIFALATGAAG